MSFMLGREAEFYIKDEGTTPKPNFGNSSQLNYARASNAARVLSTSMDFQLSREDRVDTRRSRSLFERVTGKQTITWSVETNMLPRSGSDVPNISPLIENAMGQVSTTTYSLADSLKTCMMMRLIPGQLREELFGCWVEEMSISASGGDPVTMSFSGGAMEYALTGTGTTNATANSTTVTITGDAHQFQPGSRITIADQTSAPTHGNVVVGSNSDTTTIVGAAANYATGKAITPHTPANTYTVHGTPVTGISGTVNFGGAGVGVLNVTAIDLTLTNNIKELGDEFGEKGTSAFIPGFRSISGTVSVRGTSAALLQLTRRYKGLRPTIFESNGGLPVIEQPSLVVNFGQTSGSIQTLNIPVIEIDFAAIEIPESEEVVISLPFTALATSSNNEMTLAWNQTT